MAEACAFRGRPCGRQSAGAKTGFGPTPNERPYRRGRPMTVEEQELEEGRMLAMTKRGLAAAAAAMIGLALASPGSAAEKKVFYLLSHGGPSDAFWIDWNAGAVKACDQLGVTCKISFSGGDMAAQKEALNSALAAKPDGIATTSAQPGLWTKEVAADLKEAGAIWAKYLVDRKMVKNGDKVFLAVEVPGASYQQLETEGIASIFDPLGIKYDVVDCGTDPAGIIAKMTDYIVANHPPAIIALGDSVAASIKRVFDSAGVKPGAIPTVGWGNSKDTAEEVETGYVNAAAWQYPSAQGFMPVALLSLAASGEPIGYDIHTFSLYDKSSVGPILKLYNKKK